jgi:hypothetical protein
MPARVRTISRRLNALRLGLVVTAIVLLVSLVSCEQMTEPEGNHTDVSAVEQFAQLPLFASMLQTTGRRSMVKSTARGISLSVVSASEGESPVNPDGSPNMNIPSLVELFPTVHRTVELPPDDAPGLLARHNYRLGAFLMYFGSRYEYTWTGAIVNSGQGTALGSIGGGGAGWAFPAYPIGAPPMMQYESETKDISLSMPCANATTVIATGRAFAAWVIPPGYGQYSMFEFNRSNTESSKQVSYSSCTSEGGDNTAPPGQGGGNDGGIVIGGGSVTTIEHCIGYDVYENGEYLYSYIDSSTCWTEMI